MWYLQQHDPASRSYYEQLEIRVDGLLDLPLLTRCLNEIVARHESLRTVFNQTSNGNLLQIVKDPEHTNIPVTYLGETALSEKTLNNRIRQICVDLGRMPYNMTSGPLFRVNLLQLPDNKQIFLFGFHHSILDGRSLSILLRELDILYTAYTKGTQSALAPLPIHCADYAFWEKQWLTSSEIEPRFKYWENYLRDLPLSLNLPYDRPWTSTTGSDGAWLDVNISRSLTDELTNLASQENASLFMALYCALAVLLMRYTGQTDIPIGTLAANRFVANMQNTMGFLVNTLILRTELSGEKTFRELLKELTPSVTETIYKQVIPFNHQVNIARADGRPEDAQPFQVVLGFKSIPYPERQWCGLKIGRPKLQSMQVAKFPITISLEMGDAGIEGFWEYNIGLFDKNTMQRMQRHFLILLEGIVKNPDQSVNIIPLLTESESQNILYEWNSTSAPYPADTSVHQLFKQQAKKSPARIAVVHGMQHFSYDELDSASNQLALCLMTRGIKLGDKVAIYMERSPDMIIGLLGIIKAGAVYVPIDPEYPSQRILFMLEDSDIALVLIKGDLSGGIINNLNRAYMILNSDQLLTARNSPRYPKITVGANTPIYIIYTSGSTGQPKGVVVPHQAVSRLVFNSGYMEFDKEHTFLQLASPSFDAATFEIWGALLHGGRCVLYPDRVPTIDTLELIVAEQCIDSVFLTTSLFNLIVDERPKALLPITTLLVGGEAASIAHFKQAAVSCPNTKIVNVYGPTENTTFTTYYPFFLDENNTNITVPVGRPISNTTTYILDNNLRPVPIGVVGRLYTGGAGLALGYLNHPELTEQRFIANPFNDMPNELLYDTGDLAKYLADGNIEYIGRVDNQVKVRGFRIELGEIETCLRNHPSIEQCVVLAPKNKSGVKYLAAYLVPNPDYDFPEASTKILGTYTVDQWEDMYNNIYADAVSQESTFEDFVGWNSSYTGKPIPHADMVEWANSTAERIRALRPVRILEIGCGTGLLLGRLVADCEHYTGTDFSTDVLNQLKSKLPHLGEHARKVTLLAGRADNLQELNGQYFDTIILNSVVQYFPNIEYLASVLTQAQDLLTPGGRIFVGDVRHLGLLETFHCSAQWFRTKDALKSVDHFKQLVQHHSINDKELVIAPAFFQAFQIRSKHFTHVQIFPKLGNYQNELSQYRYDVVLHTNTYDSFIENIFWKDWSQNPLTAKQIHACLKKEQPPILAFTCVTNARIYRDVALLRALYEFGDSRKAPAAFKDFVKTINVQGVTSYELQQLTNTVPYMVEISWARGSKDGSFDVVFYRRRTDRSDLYCVFPIQKAIPETVPYRNLSNNPQLQDIRKNLIPILRNYLIQSLPEYMIPSFFVLLNRFPLNANGKIDRKALPKPDAGILQNQEYVAPQTRTEKLLAKIWSEVLGIDSDIIGIHDNFFELGGHSMLSIQSGVYIKRTFDIFVQLRDLFSANTIRKLASLIDELKVYNQPNDGYNQLPLKKLDRTSGIPIRKNQQSVLRRLKSSKNKIHGIGNTYVGFRIVGNLNVVALRWSFNKLVARHESLRTIFSSLEDNAVQIIKEQLNIMLPVINIDETELTRCVAEHTRHNFDVLTGPLFRADLFRLSSNDHAILINMRHIISDGWSLTVILREISTLYTAAINGNQPQLAPLPFQFADYVLWKHSRRKSQEFKRQLKTWKEMFKEAPISLQWPTDQLPLDVPTRRGASICLSLPAELIKHLQQLSQAQKSSLFMTLFAGYNVLLACFTGQTDICTITMRANRDWPELKDMIGLVMDNQILRTRMHEQMSFLDLLNQVKETTLAAYDCPDLSVEDQKKVMNINLATFHCGNFNYLGISQFTLTLPDLETSLIDNPLSIPEKEVFVQVYSNSDVLKIFFNYNKDFYQRDTIEKLSHSYKAFLEEAVKNPRQSLGVLSSVYYKGKSRYPANKDTYR